MCRCLQASAEVGYVIVVVTPLCEVLWLSTGRLLPKALAGAPDQAFNESMEAATKVRGILSCRPALTTSFTDCARPP